MACVGLPGAERLIERWFPPFPCDLPVLILIQRFAAPRCFDLLVFCSTAKPTLSLDADAREGLALTTSPAFLVALLTQCGRGSLCAELAALPDWGWQQTLAEPLGPAPTEQEHWDRRGASTMPSEHGGSLQLWGELGLAETLHNLRDPQRGGCLLRWWCPPPAHESRVFSSSCDTDQFKTFL